MQVILVEVHMVWLEKIKQQLIRVRLQLFILLDISTQLITTQILVQWSRRRSCFRKWSLIGHNIVVDTHSLSMTLPCGIRTGLKFTQGPQTVMLLTLHLSIRNLSMIHIQGWKGHCTFAHPKRHLQLLWGLGWATRDGMVTAWHFGMLTFITTHQFQNQCLIHVLFIQSKTNFNKLLSGKTWKSTQGQKHMLTNTRYETLVH